MIVAVSFAFLTPRAAVLIVLALVPVGAIVVAERRVARVRSALSLDAPAQHRRRTALVAAAVLAMVLAAMQPVVKTEQAAHARTDAQAFVVIDTSRSMAAGASPSAPKRLARAKRAALDAAASLGDVPVGVATFTDRVLPILFPTANRAAFDSAVEALTIEDPPPRDVNTVATSFGALAALGTQGFFPSRVHKRAAIVVTDGESRPFDPGTLTSTLSGHGIRLAVVPVGTGGDRVFRPDGKPEAAYRPDPKAAAQSLARLGGLTPARLRQALGSGPEPRDRRRAAHEIAGPHSGPPRAPCRRRSPRARSAGGHLESHTMADVKILLSAGAATLLLLLVSGASGASVPAGDWLGFGRTTDNMRHSPLTEITRANADQLGRAYTVDLKNLDADTRRGEQSYPLAINGTLFVTTNDAQVFALNGSTGKMIWHYKPSNSGLFKNFGIVANRGLAYCDGALFLLTLDMHLNKLNPSNGALLGRVAIGASVPGAGSNYGYSETSAPICANHKVIAGAAGSEYGIRGYVMAWNTKLRPAWPNPVWTIPPEQQSWRAASRIVGGGAVWTPVTADTSTNTVFFGTGSATPLYFPSIRPGTNPRTDSLVAVDLNTGKLKWWRQLIAGNQWSYDVAQPPLVYDGTVGGHRHHVVSVATMEGVWFAFDANTGAPFYSRVKVIDRIEHPALRPGKPVTVFPSSLGGLNYSPASYDPTTNYVFNAAAETAGVDIQSKLTPTQKKHKFVLGDVFLGLDNGNFGTELAGWHDHGSISAIDVNTGKRVWKFQTPEPERGGVTTTASGLGFAGGGDGVLRAFNTKTGKILWTFQTGHQIAAGPTVFTDNGKEYVAVTVGGTPTSSGGGVFSQLQVFTLGGSKTQSPPPQLSFKAPQSEAAAATSPRLVQMTRPQLVSRTTAKSGAARIATQGPFAVRIWSVQRPNTQVVSGTLLLGGKPVRGAAMEVDKYTLTNRTNARGQFFYGLDLTLPRRHIVRAVALSKATVGGRALTAAERSAVLRVAGGFSVGYRVNDLHASATGGHVVVSGRLSYASGTPAPRVVLFTYRLSGTITDASGRPVAGATVVTRTQDRDFWTFSQPSDAAGHYTSFFTASDERGVNPVPLTVQVASGSVSYASPVNRNVNFTALRSATMNVQLPASPTGVLALPAATSFPGAVYEGTLVGVSGPGGVIKPVRATWPDAHGRFTLVLPGSARGKPLRVWENYSTFFQTHNAVPGGPIDLSAWPTIPPGDQPQGLAVVRAR